MKPKRYANEMALLKSARKVRSTSASMPSDSVCTGSAEHSHLTTADFRSVQAREIRRSDQKSVHSDILFILELFFRAAYRNTLSPRLNNLSCG